jgi:phosphate transport system substrate-binding protein
MKAQETQEKLPMRKLGRPGLILSVFFLFAAVSSPAAFPADLQGTVRVTGAWALYPMMIKWGQVFMQAHPKVRVDVAAGGAGKGVADVLTGIADIGMVSREITAEEVKLGALPIPVAKDAVFPTVSEANPVLKKGLSEKGMKKATLLALWIDGKPLTWGEVSGTGAKQKIHVYTRSDACGAAETWARFLGDKRQEDLKGVGVYGDPGLAEAVRKDPLGVGYNNLNYAFDMTTGLPLKGLALLPFDINGNGRVDPAEEIKGRARAMESLNSGVYPSPPGRDLYLMTKAGLKGIPREFIHWILTEGQKYVEENGYVRLSKERLQEGFKKLGSP